MKFKGIYFDFGFVLAFPARSISTDYYYLNWDGITNIFQDEELMRHLRSNINPAGLKELLQKKIVDVYIAHEKSDLVNPDIFRLFKSALSKQVLSNTDDSMVSKVLRYLDTMALFSIDPKVVALLTALTSKGHCISLVSNMLLPAFLLKDKLDRDHISGMFSSISISSEVGFMKPHGRIFMHALERDNLRPEDVVFIGDSYAQDMAGASRIGMHTVWYNSRNENESPAMKLHDYKVNTAEQLWELLLPGTKTAVHSGP